MAIYRIKIKGKDMATQEEVKKILEGIEFKNLTTEQITGEHGLLKILTRRMRRQWIVR